MSIWDHPDLKIGGEFVKFDAPGDSVTGTIQVIRPHRFDDGSVAAQILLVTDQGEERTVTCGQIRLKTALAEQRPEAGDWIGITLTQIEKRAGGKELKHFTVEVRRGAGQPPQAAAPAPQGYAPPAQPQPYAAPPAQPYGAPQAPQGYPAAPPVQQYAPPAPMPPAPAQPMPAPMAQPAAPAPQAPAAQQPQTPEQAAALAALTPQQRIAMGYA